jgi:hypothetical protein
MSDRPEFLDFSPQDVLAMGYERGLDAGTIAEGVKRHRANLEGWGRDNARASFWQGSAQLDRDTEEALNALREKEQQRIFDESVPNPREQQNFIYQMEAGGFDPEAVDERFRPLAKQMDEAWSDPIYTLPTHKIHGGSVDVNGVPLARYSLRRGTSNGKVDVGLSLGDEMKEDFIQVDEVTDEDVSAEIQKSLNKAKLARDEARRLTESSQSFLARVGDGGAAVLKSAAVAEERAGIEESRAKALEKGGQLYLLGERIRDTLKQPEWRDKVGEYAGGTEFYKGLLQASITTGAAWAGATGDKEMLAKMVEGQNTLEQALPGSTRRELEGGIWNKSVKGSQQALGQMAPYVAGGMILRGGTALAGAEQELARQMAGRLGPAGVGMSVSAAGGGYIDTENEIGAALKAGDVAKAERIRRGQHWHAWLTGLAEGAVERLGAAQALNAGGRGVKRLAKEILQEGVEEPITGGIQRGLVDPLTIGRYEDVFAPMAEEGLTGLLAAGPLVGASAGMNRLMRQGEPQADGDVQTVEGEPSAVVPPREVPPLEEAPPGLDNPPDANSFQGAQNAGSDTDPEPLVTLTAQRALVETGRKPAMIVDGVKVADLPAELTGGLRWIDTEAGAVGFRADVYTELEVRTLAEDPKLLGKLLGYGVGAKPEAGDRVVVLEDQDGNEVVSTAADDATVDDVAGSLTVMSDPAQGQTVTVLPADQGGIILNQREANRKAEAGLENSGRPTNDVLQISEPGENQQLEPGAAIRDKAGQQPGMEATPSVAAESAESAATEAKSPRKLRVKIPPRADGVPDILDWISEQGAIERPPPIKKDKMGRKLDQRGEHDGLRSFRESFPAWYRVVTAARGRKVDVLAQIAFEENLISSADVDVFLAEIQKAFEQRRHTRAEQRARQKAEQAGEKKVIAQGKRQDAAWGKANRPEKGSVAVPSEEMIPGMVLDVDGEPMTVVDVEYDEDGNWEGALLEDGDRFGRQWVANGELVYADEVVTPDVAVIEDDPFSLTEPPAAEQSATDALFAEDEMPFNLVSETAEDVQRREAAQAAYEAQERAKEVEEARRIADGQQGRLFDDDAKGGATMASVKRAQLPRQQTPVGPVRAPGQLVTLAQIRRHLLAVARLPTVGVGRFLQRALGIYKLRAEAIRLKAINDIPTLAHEIGHAIHFRVLSKNPSGPAEAWGGRFDAELIPLGQVTSTPSYSKAKVRAEGVAEFARLWLTDPAAAMAAAPKFSAHWYKELQTKAPGMLQGLNEGQRMISDYIAMPDWQKAKAQVVFDPASERPGRTWGEWLRRGYAAWVNTLQPAQDVLKKAAQLDPSLARIAERVNTWMENHRGGWQSKANGDLFINQTDLEGKVIGPSLKAVLADIQPGDRADFSTYLALKRARELQARGIKSGFDHLKIPAAQMHAFERRFEATRQKLLKLQDNAVKLLVESGILSGEAHRQMREANRDYVPFYRLYEGLTGTRTGVESSRNAGGYVDTGTGIRRIKGSDLAIVDPLQSIMRNIYVFRKLAEQNHIGVQFFDLVAQVQGYGQFADDIAPKKTPTKISHEEVVKKLIEAGVIQSEADLPMGADLAITLWRAMHRPDSKTGEVIVHKSGQAQHWEVKDPMLFNALKTADADAVRFFKASPALTKILTIPTQILRFTATAGNPVFAFRNWFRDQVMASVNSQTGYMPFWDGVIGAIKVAKKHPDYARWVQAGGKFAGLTTSDRAFTAMVEDVLPKDRHARAMMRGLVNPRHIKRALMVVGEILEEATRVQEFSRGLKQGKTDLEAANLSKVVSMNFARAGEVSRSLNMVIAFFNAGVQDLDQVFRQHWDPKRRGSVMMKGLIYITLPSVLAWALGKDDEEIQNLPDWRKNFFWNFNLRPMAALTGRRGFILSLPKPFLMGAIYGTSVERALDYATDRDPNGATKAAKNVLANTLFHGDLLSGFTAFQPIGEVLTNKDMFRQMPVVPEQMEHLPAEMQFTLQTSETAKLLGRATGQSPLIIDHLIAGHFAGLGKMGTDGIDWALTKIGAGDAAPGPAKDLFEFQPLKSFAGTPYESSAFVTRFYAAAKDMEGLLRTWSQQSQLMTTTEQQRFWKSKGPEILLYQRVVNGRTKLTAAGEVRQMQKHLSEINKAMKTVQASRELSPMEKREKLIELSRQRNQAAENGFKNLFPETVRKRHY